VASKVVPAMTTPNVVSRLADPGWLEDALRLAWFLTAQHAMPSYPRNFLEVPEFLEICARAVCPSPFLERSSQLMTSSGSPQVRL
jgi:hypothetical protein